MTGWIVLLILLGILAVLLFSPAVVTVLLAGGSYQITVRYLFLRLVLPGKKKAPKKEPAKRRKPVKKKAVKPEKKEEKPKEPWTAERFRRTVTLVKELLKTAHTGGGRLFRGLKIRRLRLEIMTVREDAFQTAMFAGTLNAEAYTAAALLMNFVRVEDLFINIYPGFWAARETLAFEAVMQMAPYRAFLFVGTLLFGSFSPLMRFLKESKQASSEEPSEQAAQSGGGTENAQPEMKIEIKP